MEINEKWVDEMIKRQILPKRMREELNEFCRRYGIGRSTYYYYLSKKENQKKIIKECLMLAKEYTPEVLDKLAQKAAGGDMKAIDMFLNYVLELSTNFDIKTDGERIGLFDYRQKNDKQHRPDNGNGQNKEDEEEIEDLPRGNIGQQDI